MAPTPTPTPDRNQFPGWYIGVSTVAMLGFFTWVASTLVAMQSTQATMVTEQKYTSQAVASLQATAAAASGSTGIIAERLQAVEFRLELVERTVRIPIPATRRDHTLTTAPHR